MIDPAYGNRLFASLIVLLCWGSSAVGQSVSLVHTFPLWDVKDLVLVNVKAATADYEGRRAVRLTNESNKDGFALLRDTDFENGTIEADIALKITTPPGVRMPGFVGVAFRAQADASQYELFYLRPGNAVADDQAMRNHSVQYVSIPDFDWYRLRREWPWVYEAYADLQTETWTHVKIEVKDRSAKVYLNRSSNPSLTVDGLKGQDLRGGVALWPYPGEEAYFSNVRITHVPLVSVKNGSDVAGRWQVKYLSDAGTFDGVLQLSRDRNTVTGTWNGKLGNERPVRGTWHNGYIEISFDAEWPGGGLGTPGTAMAMLAGWVDDDTAGGRMRVKERADGRWTGTRIKP